MDTDVTDLANAMPESKGLVEANDEWWLDLVAIPKSARYVTWTPRAPGYRRGWGYALAESARFEAIDFRRADGRDATGVVLHEPTGRVFVAWFSAGRRDEARRVVERLNEEVAAIWMHWRAFGGGQEPRRQLTFEQGHEHAPDARWGLLVLTLADDGRYTLLLRRAGRLLSAATGNFDSALAAAVFDALDRSTFPQMPAHAFPPGATVLAISMPPDRRVEVDRRFGLGLDGYRDAIAALMDLTQRARAAAELPPGQRATDGAPGEEVLR